MTTRPYLLLGASVLVAARRALDTVVERWCQDWGVKRDEVVVECVRAWDGARQMPAAPEWRQPWQAGARSMALAWPDDMAVQLRRAMFGAERLKGASVLAEKTADAAWHELVKLVSQALIADGSAGREAAPAPVADWQYASGSLLLVLRIGRHACHALLNQPATTQLFATQKMTDLPALAPVAHQRLLSQVPVRLPVHLGEANADLGSLVRLEAGDVIRLDTSADQPLSVRLPGVHATVLFDGYLGRSDGAMALELAPYEHELTPGKQE